MGLHKRLKLSSYVIVTLISTLKQHVVYICLYNFIYIIIYIIVYIYSCIYIYNCIYI